mgnify:CR=1 FL=1
MQTEEKRENIEEKKEERMEMPVSGALEREPGKAPVSGAEISVRDTENGHPSEDVYILAIESSCDETAASVVKRTYRSFQYHIFPDRSSHAVWRRCAGDCVEKAYREDQPGY